MSLTVTSCHGYEATITGWPSGITKAWAFVWFKTSDGSAHRGLVQLTENVFDGTQDYLSLSLDGSIIVAAGASTANVDQQTPDPGDFYLWQAAQQNKWTVGCAVLDTAGTAADLKCIYGRAAATAKAATTQTAGVDLVATSAALTRIRVLADRRRVINGSSTDDSSMSTIKAAYAAVGQGDLPTQAQIQSCIDGMHPADLPGVWEYWDLTSSSAGLVGALQGVTLAPFGGAATTTWDGADNPTVSAPSGGGSPTYGTATETDAALPATGQQRGTYRVASETDTALALTSLAGLPFNTSANEFGQRTGVAIDDWALYASVELNVAVYADADLLLASKLFSFTETTGTNGRLARRNHASLVAGSWYFAVVRNADGSLNGAVRLQAVA